jgi:excisionase family DNA binding protein
MLRDMMRVSVPEAARLLGCNKATVYRQIKAGQIPATRDGQGRLLVTVGSSAADGDVEETPGTDLLTEVSRRCATLEAQNRDVVERLAVQDKHIAEQDAHIRELTVIIARLLPVTEEAQPPPRPGFFRRLFRVA